MKIKYNSPVVLTFALICGAVLGINYLTAGASNTFLFSTYRGSMLNPLTYIRLFTHVLGHANLSHYVNNMMLFMLLGPMLEEKYGSKKLVAIIAISAFITGIVNMVLSNNALLGASGVVFTFVVLSSMTAFEKKEIPLTLIIVAVLYIGNELLDGAFSKDNISQLAHIFGGLTGALCGFAITPMERMT